MVTWIINGSRHTKPEQNLCHGKTSFVLFLICDSCYSHWHSIWVQSMSPLFCLKSVLLMQLSPSCPSFLLQNLGLCVALWQYWPCYLHGLVQVRCNSSALAMELRLSCTKPSISSWMLMIAITWLSRADCWLIWFQLYMSPAEHSHTVKSYWTIRWCKGQCSNKLSW